MDEEPTTLTGLRSTISKRAADVRDAITAFTQNVATHLTTAETAAASAKQHAENAEAQLTAASNSNTAISKLETDATAAYTEFDAVINKAMDPNTGVKTVVAAVTDLHEEAQELKTEISGFRDESLIMQGDIEKSRDDSQEMQKTLSTVLTDSQEIRENIEKTYKIATDAGLAGSLSQRKADLAKQVVAWGVVAVLSFLLTIWVIHLLLPDLTKQGQPATIILSKLFYISPTALFTVFAITQYRNERRLLEEYAFKAVMANSLESYTQLLGREFNDPTFRQQILNFVLPAMKDIYDRDPLVAPKVTFSWKLGSKIAKLEATVKEEASMLAEKTVQVKDDISTQLDEISDEFRQPPVDKKPKTSRSAT